MDGVHHQDMQPLLDQQSIAVRAGHHYPLMDALNVKGTVRISFGIYNNMDSVKKKLITLTAIEKAVDML